MNYTKKILVTGGAGFIGSHLLRLLVNKYPQYQLINGDLLTYAGNLENLTDLESSGNYVFEKMDITDEAKVAQLFQKYKFTDVIHLAAESHVDRSIDHPLEFLKTNIIGTGVLLNQCRHSWNDDKSHLFYHVSTDEVYGSLGDTGFFTESTAYDPRSPYSASKASSDHLVRAYHHTFQLPIVISNCSNNYGPNQFPEKLIPLIINNILHEKPLPVYGDGTNVRDWLWVGDHATAIDRIFHEGKLGETYNVGGDNEMQNIDLVRMLCKLVDKKLNREEGSAEKTIRFVTDRKGHDQRYAIDATKIKEDLKWEPSVYPNEGFEKTVEWYLENTTWLKNVTSGDYQQYYNKYYK